MRGIIDVNPNDLFEFNNSRTRGHEYKLRRNHMRIEMRKNFFANRIFDQWNALPNFVVCANSLNLFKQHLTNNKQHYVNFSDVFVF